MIAKEPAALTELLKKIFSTLKNKKRFLRPRNIKFLRIFKMHSISNKPLAVFLFNTCLFTGGF